ncbi:MAG: TrmJ/YjtD family RNA methyltransferase [Treponema sp.]|jgi:tRNA/rRNA methyltransferase/tRNA (cytidine32/uridine32-2'-O)-methyltransferase|nr:TrmJ/YjtD family RNA methyltransferase [Treponema sp.]
MTLSDIIVVLVRPEESGNVGAVCRAMKNSGLSRLRLVNPAEMHEGTIRARAVHAEDVWLNAGRFASLEEALADCSLVIGTTRRRGRKRKSVSMPPDEAALFLKTRDGNAALLFGNERAGLEDRELDLCSLASHIPVSNAFPSLNLSHAVQIYGYELFKTLSGVQFVAGQWIPMSKERVDVLARSVTNSLERLGFYKQRGGDFQERFFRDVFSRAGLSEQEGGYMADIFAKAARLAMNGRTAG